MTQAQQPEALRLAEQCDNFDTRAPIAACLRAQHARIQELEMNLVHRLEVYTASLEQIVCLQDRIQELEQGKCLLQIAEPAAVHLDDVAVDALTPAARDVLAERKRQIEAEGWKTERDDVYDTGEMALAAACYAAHSASCAAIKAPHTAPGVFVRTRSAQDFVGEMWPWSDDWWKPSGHRRNLEKAGALVLAEIERIDRAALAAQAKQGGAA